MAKSPKHLIFLDGECAFCQRSAQLVHKLDKKQRFLFAPLHGETAEMLPEGWNFSTKSTDHTTGAMVLVENYRGEQTLWRGADAALRTLKLIGGLWGVFWPLRHFPRHLKDGAYHLIATNRYRIAGKKNVCDLPDSGFREKMLP